MDFCQSELLNKEDLLPMSGELESLSAQGIFAEKLLNSRPTLQNCVKS